MIRRWGSLQYLGAEAALDAALGDIDEAAMNRYPPLGIDEVLTEAAVQEHFSAALDRLTTAQPDLKQQGCPPAILATRVARGPAVQMGQRRREVKRDRAAGEAACLIALDQGHRRDAASC
jgi:hypothetical protein